MAGRGRGRQSSTLTQEQLQSLGCSGKDMPPVATAPPPTFPPLLTKPVLMEVSAAQNYKTLWKEDFLNHMRDSPYYLMPKKLSNKIQRYSDQYVNVLENSKEKSKVEIPWHLIPAELRPNYKRKNNASIKPVVKKIRQENIEERLKVLEEKEKIVGTGVDKKLPQSDSEAEEDENENEQDIEEDDEMDEDNDYGNNYFDNGEAFNEEDDNLDDGPVY